jgi:hypothetical protein
MTMAGRASLRSCAWRGPARGHGGVVTSARAGAARHTARRPGGTRAWWLPRADRRRDNARGDFSPTSSLTSTRARTGGVSRWSSPGETTRARGAPTRANHSRSSRSCRANWHAEDEFQSLLPVAMFTQHHPRKRREYWECSVWWFWCMPLFCSLA